MTARWWVRALLAAIVVAFAVLTVTGVLLSFFYFPDASTNDVTSFSDVLQPIHWGSAIATLVLVVALAGVLLERQFNRWPRRIGLVVTGTAIALVGLVVAFARGGRLAWTQIALWAVTIGTNMRGVWMRDDVKFFLRDAGEVSVRAYSREVWLHVALAPAIAVIGIAILVVAATRDRAAGQPGPSGSATKLTSASS